MNGMADRRGDALLRAFARDLAKMRRDLRNLEAANQISSASIEGGTLDVYDDDDVLRERIGKQANGSYGRLVLEGPVPPIPSEPDVQVIADGVVAITWDGRSEEKWPFVEFEAVRVHLVSDPVGELCDRDNQVGAIFAARGGTIVAVTESDDDNPVYARLVAVSTAGHTSDPSPAALVDELDEDDLEEEPEELQWEDGDGHTLVQTDIDAGTVTFGLSHIPEEESLLAWWHPGGLAYAGVPQERGVDFTVDNESATVTWPLTGCEQVDDRLRVYYPYYELGPIAVTVIGTGGQEGSPVMTPPETQVGNLLVAFIAISEQRQVVSNANGWTKVSPVAPDIAADTWDPDGGEEAQGLQVWWKVADSAGSVAGPAITTNVNPNWSGWSCIALDGFSRVESVAYSAYDVQTGSAPPPALDGAHLTYWRSFRSSSGALTIEAPPGAPVYLLDGLTGRQGLTTAYTREPATCASPTDWIACAVRLA